MKFTINERKVTVSPAVKEYAEKKISKLDRFFKNECETQITFSSSRGMYITEVTLANDGLVLRVSQTMSDLNATIDASVSAIERQIRKHKTRLAKRLREGFTEVLPAASSAADEDEEAEFKIVRSKMFPIKPMSAEEAVLQMNLLDHSFYVFKNQDKDGSFAVVYKRKDGDYGMIEELNN